MDTSFKDAMNYVTFTPIPLEKLWYQSAVRLLELGSTDPEVVSTVLRGPSQIDIFEEALSHLFKNQTL